MDKYHTPICEPIVKKMWEPPRLTTQRASTACYKNSFTCLLYFAEKIGKQYSNIIANDMREVTLGVVKIKDRVGLDIPKTSFSYRC
jgi:hypothetical protein